MYKFYKKIIRNPNFFDIYKRIDGRFRRVRYNLDIIRQAACIVFNPFMVESYASLLSCTAVVEASDSMTVDW